MGILFLKTFIYFSEGISPFCFQKKILLSIEISMLWGRASYSKIAGSFYVLYPERRGDKYGKQT